MERNPTGEVVSTQPRPMPPTKATKSRQGTLKVAQKLTPSHKRHKSDKKVSGSKEKPNEDGPRESNKVKILENLLANLDLKPRGSIERILRGQTYRDRVQRIKTELDETFSEEF